LSERAPKGAGGYLLDTHIWFWYLTGSERLKAPLRGVMDGALGELWLSPISVWELGMLEQRGRVGFPSGFRRWTEEALRVFPLKDAPVMREVALRSREVRLPHRDPADRFLAATALIYGLTLITADERLAAARGIPTRSR
jgi:PIN domain nuclease of toxin-antitoxin system